MCDLPRIPLGMRFPPGCIYGNRAGLINDTARFKFANTTHNGYFCLGNHVGCTGYLQLTEVRCPSWCRSPALQVYSEWQVQHRSRNPGKSSFCGLLIVACYANFRAFSRPMRYTAVSFFGLRYVSVLVLQHCIAFNSTSPSITKRNRVITRCCHCIICHSMVLTSSDCKERLLGIQMPLKC